MRINNTKITFFLLIIVLLGCGSSRIKRIDLDEIGNVNGYGLPLDSNVYYQKRSLKRYQGRYQNDSIALDIIFNKKYALSDDYYKDVLSIQIEDFESGKVLEKYCFEEENGMRCLMGAYRLFITFDESTATLIKGGFEYRFPFGTEEDENYDWIPDSSFLKKVDKL